MGNYSEESPSDADDLYGRSKFLGEVRGDGATTLRASLIGRELESYRGLTEWFLTQRRKSCKGYAKAVYTGLTTLAFSESLAKAIEKNPGLTGLYQVSGEPISKYDSRDCAGGGCSAGSCYRYTEFWGFLGV